MNRWLRQLLEAAHRALREHDPARRQPVMQKYFEKLLISTTSPGKPRALQGSVPYTRPW